jgi:hypothetical protein
MTWFVEQALYHSASALPCLRTSAAKCLAAGKKVKTISVVSGPMLHSALAMP